jgi:undecaprenyl-diphosphatase
MDMLHAIAIAILQGATELFPISSLGHAVVVPALFNWPIDQKSPEYLPFLVLLHTGTAAALLLYFWRDWLTLATGVLGLSGPAVAREQRRLFLLIVVATIPAVILGYVFNHFFRALFATPLYACVFLFLNGLLLLLAEKLRGRATGPNSTNERPGASMTTIDALVIGCWQCGALLPGISRSGATIAGGLLRGFSHYDSARFSFLIALPIIVGATVLEVPHMLHASVPPGVFQQAVIAAVIAGITAWIATALLMRWFRSNDDWALTPFAIYCLIFGAGSAAYLVMR